MSRAKEYRYDGGSIWFDYRDVATPEQLELLADLSNEPIDDLLDAGLMQKEVARRLFAMDGLVPEHVLEARRKRVQDQKNAPACRWCSLHDLTCEGRSTRHHYVPRWMMLLLENYQAYAARSRCCIPICLSRHRDLHLRIDTPKSIVGCLNEREKAFAEKMLTELREQHSVIFDLILGGEGTYESQLLQDFMAGKFRHQDPVAREMPEESAPSVRAMLGV